jgi:hypothetical protein
MGLTADGARQHIGAPLYDLERNKIGKIEAVFESTTSASGWASTLIGLLERKHRIVSLADAQAADGGLVVPFSKATVEGAPEFEPEGESLTAQEETSLHQYYAGRSPAWTEADKALDQDQYRIRPPSDEMTFGTGQARPGEPADVTLQGTGNSAPEATS